MKTHLTATLCLIALWTTSCASEGLDVPYVPAHATTAGPSAGWRVEVTDARAFTHVATVGPVPSTGKKPIDPAWTRRVFGRQLLESGVPGADVFTAAGEDVPGLVQRAVAAGAAQAAPAAPGTLTVVIDQLWIWRPQSSATPSLLYRFQLRLQSPAHGLEQGIVIENDGKVTGGMMGGRLWQQAMTRVLERIEQEVARRMPTAPEAVRHEARPTHLGGERTALAHPANRAPHAVVVRQ